METIVNTESTQWTLTLSDWRGIETLEWSPFGVSLLTGPNGSGKTSILDALSFLRSAWLRGVPAAVGWAGYAGFLRRLGADKDNPIKIGLTLGDLRWEIQLAVDGEGIHAHHGEHLYHGDDVVFRRPLYQAEWFYGDAKRKCDERTCLRLAFEREEDEHAARFAELLPSLRIYNAYWLNRAREIETGHLSDTFLHPTGKNLFSVLRNWKSAPRRFNGRFAWALEALREAFPNQIEDIEFDALGDAVQARFYPPDAPGPDDSLPVGLAADGLLTGFLHLTAVAGAEPGSVVAFDEMENQLHPHAIRSILASMRERADEKDLTIVLTTHSPVLMNAFKGYEDQFFVLQPGVSPTPTPLDELKDPEWLAHFSLGDLYDRLDFAAPAADQE